MICPPVHPHCASSQGAAYTPLPSSEKKLTDSYDGEREGKEKIGESMDRASERESSLRERGSGREGKRKKGKK